MSRALLLIDIQNDYFANGAMELVGMTEAAQNAASLLARFRDSGEKIFHVQHLAARPEAGFFLPGTEGAEINASVAPLDGESVTQKHFPNAFRDTPLVDELRQADVDALVICGAMSHMCIDASTRAAFDLGFKCTLAADACATRDLDFDGNTVSADKVHSAFMAALGAVYADVVSTASVA